MQAAVIQKKMGDNGHGLPRKRDVLNVEVVVATLVDESARAVNRQNVDNVFGVLALRNNQHVILPNTRQTTSSSASPTHTCHVEKSFRLKSEINS